jgi:hypothetical protein
MRKALHWLSFALTWTVRLVPAVALFSAFFALEGDLRWIGLFGFVPLALTAGLPGCACAARGRPAVSAWPCF